MNLCRIAFRGHILDSDLIQSRSNCTRNPLMHLGAILLHLQTQSHRGRGQRWVLWRSARHNTYVSITSSDQRLSKITISHLCESASCNGI